MCLVCFINAEESRMKKSYKININHTDTDNVDDIDDNNDERNNNHERNQLDNNFNSNHNISIISSKNNIDKNSIDTIKIDDNQSTSSLSSSSSSLTAIHYFAIGSMTNVTSIALRELSPIYSKPGILRNHRLLFRGSGMLAYSI